VSLTGFLEVRLFADADFDIQTRQEVPPELVAGERDSCVVGEEEADRVLGAALEVQDARRRELDQRLVARPVAVRVERVQVGDVAREAGRRRLVHEDAGAGASLNAVGRLSFLAVVRLVVRRLELNTEETGKRLADDVQLERDVFGGVEGTGSRAVDGRNRPRLAEAATDNIGARVTREGDHRIVAADDSATEIAADVEGDAIFGEVRHAAALVPEEVIVKSSSVVNCSPDRFVGWARVVMTVPVLEANILIDTVPKLYSGVSANKISHKLLHGEILNRDDGRAVFNFTVGKRFIECHFRRKCSVGL